MRFFRAKEKSLHAEGFLTPEMASAHLRQNLQICHSVIAKTLKTSKMPARICCCRGVPGTNRGMGGGAGRLLASAFHSNLESKAKRIMMGIAKNRISMTIPPWSVGTIF